ncbi:MAG: sugar porter family MFS transporter, partial [Tepidisphaeraceae bacterium]
MTIEDQLDAAPHRATSAQTAYVYVVASVAAVGGFLFGYDLAIIGGAILYLKKTFALNDVQEGFAMASAVIGCILGPLVAVGLADRIGRKKTLLVAAGLFGISAIGTALPATIGQFNVFRAVGGIAVGLSAIVSPMYIAEIAPARMRGRLVAVNQMGIVGGSFIAIVVSWALAHWAVPGEWRWMFGSIAVPIALLFVGLLFVPESPRWLVQRGRDEEAIRVLTRIEGDAHAIAEMKAMAATSDEPDGRFVELLRPGLRIALLVGVGLAVFQQITGTSILFANAPTVFQKAGFASESAAIGQTVLLQIWNVAVTALSMWLVDRVGRRPLLLWGVAAMGAGLVAMGLIFANRVSGIYVLLVMFFAIGAYIVSLAPLTWLIMSEIFPTRLRGKGMSVASISLWIAFFLGMLFFPIMREFFERRSGTIAGMFYTFAGVCAVAFVFFYKFVP